MKGIILAGGAGTRLYPLTIASSKQMLPVYDKPMIYYPLYALMAAGISDILIISTPVDIDKFRFLLGDGRIFGIKLSYTVQPSPDGLAQAFIIGKEFINSEPCAMILGDNIFFGDGFEDLLQGAVENVKSGVATIFGLKVPDPERFGVVQFDKDGNAVKIIEKPTAPPSDYCVTGLYFYPGDVSQKVSSLKPSYRGELEITDLNNIYLREKRLKVKVFDNCFKWWDTGTFDSLMDAAQFIQSRSRENEVSVCSPEAIAYKKGWITADCLSDLAEKYHKNSYGGYLRSLLEE